MYRATRVRSYYTQHQCIMLTGMSLLTDLVQNRMDDCLKTRRLASGGC